MTKSTEDKKETGLSSRGYWVAKSSLTASEIEALQADTTMTPSQAGGMGMMMGPSAASEIVLWRETPTRLYLPKCFGLSRFGPPPAANVTIDPGDPVTGDRLRFTGAIRPEQRKPLDCFLGAARDPGRMGGILSLPCGFGKTVAALYAISQLGVRTLVVVHKDFLLNQWRERIAEFLPDASIGLVKAKVVDVEGRDVVLASVQSLSMKEYPEGLFRGIGFVIVDECHRVGTEVFSRALHKTNFRYSLGISATVNRKDGMTKVFTAFLGDVVFSGKRGNDDVVLVVQHRYWHESQQYHAEPTISTPAGVKPNVSRMINNIAYFPPRTAAIVASIEHAIRAQPGRKVLVLSDRKAQLTELHAGLERLQPPIGSGFYWGGMKRDALAESERKQVMLATFSYAAEGMDVPSLDTLVLASPKSDIEQSVGRILRTKPIDRERAPLVIDFVDQFSLFERQGGKRAAFYRKFKYSIHRDLESALGPPGREGEEEDDRSSSEGSSLQQEGSDGSDGRWWKKLVEVE